TDPECELCEQATTEEKVVFFALPFCVQQQILAPHREANGFNYSRFQKQIRMPHTSQKIDEKLAWRCAHHEAGHAVVHLNLGDEIWRVTIDEPDNRGGRVWSSYPQSFNRGSIDMRTIADMRIIACVAGIAAELVLLGSPSSMEFYVSDLKRAHD